MAAKSRHRLERAKSYDVLFCQNVTQVFGKHSFSLDNLLQNFYNKGLNSVKFTPNSLVLPNQTTDEPTLPAVDFREAEDKTVPRDKAESASADLFLSTQSIKPPIPPKPFQFPFKRAKKTIVCDNKQVFSGINLPEDANHASGIGVTGKPFMFRLGRKVQHNKTFNLESVVREKLSLDGIDLTLEPFSDKVSYLECTIYVFGLQIIECLCG